MPSAAWTVFDTTSKAQAYRDDVSADTPLSDGYRFVAVIAPAETGMIGLCIRIAPVL